MNTHLRLSGTGQLGELAAPLCQHRIPGRLVPRRNIVQKDPTCKDCQELQAPRKEAKLHAV